MPMRGRPSTYTPEIAAAICERLATGDSLRKICRDDGMPAEATVRQWAIENREGFYAQYVRARDLGLDAMADEILDISDDNSRDVAVDEDGNEVINHDVVNRARLRVDTRKWYLSKLAPKKYGDRQSELGGAQINVIVHRDGAMIDVTPSHHQLEGEKS